MVDAAKPTLDAVFIGHRGALVRLLARMVGSAATAEDLAQEAYLKVRAAERDRPVEYPAPFLFQTARNLALDHLRRERRNAVVVTQDITAEGMEEVAAPLPSPETAAGDRQRLARMETALAALSERQRRILLLNRMEGLSHAQIAERLEVSVSTVQKDLKTALLACLEVFARLDREGRPDREGQPDREGLRVSAGSNVLQGERP
ncbi:sigma-70 family RNA polymerase sigma factor [Azospirillum brasilense]|uniref:RNA polymerase sigma factor n=1 Tax=Azospirillum brasilense TaxID=192 RepID=UPI00039B09F8|nr:RNA polymerase sigma factor [Azospirillum brasilense]MDW7556324.1 RNA polymerase sigma factor [Azospirillum brasilense]NUB13883.1 sigma-70 family RNA polymerase sigma factor [Azospirillum brasilense]NUB25697.1 sigma-70 family RNA polymerase sigma factor [Azospirillum brasilense]NUB33742.1 sigma-70 family RNA polymerase sigma factor [Azospirillum brasilense]RIW00618.1 RNA polymerase sigma factor [Azospirillum brasilense]